MRQLCLFAGKNVITNQLSKRLFLKQIKSNYLNQRFLSTSKKLFAEDPIPPLDPKKYGGTGVHNFNPDYRLRPPPPKSIEDFANPDKTGHWMSYGYDEVDINQDRHWYRNSYFFIFTLFIPAAFLVFFYEPDYINGNDWYNREAYLELHRREKYGLPLVDPEFLPREKVIATLPPEADIKIDVHY